MAKRYATKRAIKTIRTRSGHWLRIPSFVYNPRARPHRSVEKSISSFGRRWARPSRLRAPLTLLSIRLLLLKEIKYPTERETMCLFVFIYLSFFNFYTVEQADMCRPTRRASRAGVCVRYLCNLVSSSQRMGKQSRKMSLLIYQTLSPFMIIPNRTEDVPLSDRVRWRVFSFFLSFLITLGPTRVRL